MRSIVILGAGELGGALARQLAAADIASTVVLVDDAATIAEGKALDIRQAASIDRYTTNVIGTTDQSVVVGADALVIADRFSTPGAPSGEEWQGDAGSALIQRLALLNPGAMIVCAGARQMEMVERGVRESGIQRHRLLGSAPEALRSGIVSMTALEAGCTPADVCLTVVGRPPAQIIVPWDDASIAGRRATDLLPPPAITRLDARLPRLWPPGPLTLAAAATRVLASAASRGRRILSVFVAITREEGDRGRVAMLPVTVTTTGVANVMAPNLSSRDRVRLDSALQR